jgi:nicotinamidase/pyrazinamidase
MIHEAIDMSKMSKNCKMYIFKKGMDSDVDSYSAFYDNGRKNSTGLSEFLKERNIKQCDFVGLALDYCVMWSAEDAVKEGFESSIIIEATKAIDPNFNVAQLSKKGIKIIL